MTGMLASVCNVKEAQQVLDVGVDIIDLKNPLDGALGALDNELVKEIVEFINGVKPISATIGNLPCKAEILEPEIRKMALTGVDIIKIGVFERIDGKSELEMLSRLSKEGFRIVLVFFAEHFMDNRNLEDYAKAGVIGVMLDTLHKQNGSLAEKLEYSTLSEFVKDGKRLKMLVGLAGSLNETHVLELVETGADYLGFRGGLCKEGNRSNVLDTEMAFKVRSKITIDGIKKTKPGMPA
jgi:(5-formylfuran-3-yl)methyl phosphate synthase